MRSRVFLVVMLVRILYPHTCTFSSKSEQLRISNLYSVRLKSNGIARHMMSTAENTTQNHNNNNNNEQMYAIKIERLPIFLF